MWTKAFWKDAAERVFFTFVAVLVGVFSAEGFSTDSLDNWSFWAPILITTGVTVVKALGFGAISPNTGASAGTAVPGEIVSAYTTLTTQQTKARDGYGGGLVTVHPGDTVAGPAAAVQDGKPVQVSPLPPVETVGTE